MSRILKECREEAKEMIDLGIIDKPHGYDEWYEFFSQWCERHSISTDSGISILTESRFNKDTPDKSLPIYQDMFDYYLLEDYLAHYMKEGL